ncbi:MFS general substrate transporter [Apiospora arundinis]|uniref:MFS general substrate transporter n=1 Tax=Apiospora arundinis TaxID=335852 RepID=A0ABR2HU08_9PEZI
MGANITSHPPMDDSSAQALEKDGADVVCLEQSATMSKDAKVEASAKSLDLSVKEQYQKLWTSMKSQRRFCWWALYVMVLTFAWGYDQGLSGTAIAFPEFRKVYGNYYTQGDQWVIPALWQSLWNAASTIGQVFGGFLAGQFVDTFGRKFLLYAAVAISLGSSFALVFAPSLPVLFVSKLLLGFSVGLSTVVPPLYVTETAPADLRSTASSLTNVVIVLGFFVSSLTGFGASKIKGVWSFKLAFIMTFLVPGLYLIGLPFLPESPVWYMKKGREEDAKKSILRLYGQDADVGRMIETIKEELRSQEGDASAVSQTTWKAIFSKENRSRTLVAVLGLQVQNFSGGYFANTYQTYYFELIGQTNAFGLTAISSSLQVIANCVAVVLSDVIPRRKGLVGGGTLLLFWSVIIGGTSMAPKSNAAANTALLVFMITWSMLYTGSLGCFGWAVAQETAAQSTRPKTIAFALIWQQLTALLLSSVFPFFINPDELNWGGKIMFLFVAAEMFILLGLYFTQPETKNRTYAELELLYANKIPARKFKDCVIVDGQVVVKESKSFFGKLWV